MRSGLYLLSIVFLAACTTKQYKDSGPSGPVDVSGIADAIPKHEPLSERGNPSSYVVFGKRYYVLETAEDFREKGIASWYGNKFHGNQTSSGELYDMYAMTAAHKRLPLPSYVKVTNLNNQRTVVVKVNDRGPFHKGRVIDLSFVAAKKLGIDKSGTAPVEIVALKAAEQHPSLASIREGESIAVQIGAYSIRQSAEKVRAQLATQINAEVRISEVYSQGKKLYRVRIGPFDNIDSAKHWIEKLDQLAYGKASLVYLN